jgi:3-deoxy-manno-octulosonate cytidylyltransferase (CMP-KDO synthetase)
MIIVIPSRLASMRFPGKPLKEIFGVPLIVHVWRRGKETGLPVLVATPDREIKDVIEGEGGDVILTGVCESGSDRVWQAANRLVEQHEVVINLQGDLPFIRPEHVLLGLEALGDVGTLVYRDTMTAYYPEGFRRLTVLRHIGVYAYKRDALERFAFRPPDWIEVEQGLEQLRFARLGLTVGITEIDELPPSVDTPEDIERIESFARWFS